MDNMTITNAQYVTDMDGSKDHIKATINGQDMAVPMDPDNIDYAAILEWAEEDGNEIAAAD